MGFKFEFLYSLLCDKNSVFYEVFVNLINFVLNWKSFKPQIVHEREKHLIKISTKFYMKGIRMRKPFALLHNSLNSTSL